MQFGNLPLGPGVAKSKSVSVGHQFCCKIQQPGNKSQSLIYICFDFLKKKKWNKLWALTHMVCTR